jgi:iron complex transport system permease protein
VRPLSKSLAALVLACPVLIAASVFLGPDWNHPGRLLADELRPILWLRIWRVALGAAVGASLGLAGATLQAVLRNPLADPYVLGISAGAGLASVLFIALGGLTVAAALLPAAGFAGALASLFAVYLLARVDRRTHPHTLILGGIAWGSLCASLLMFIVSRSSAEGLHAVLWWFLGDLQAFDLRLVKLVLVVNALAAALLIALARDLNALVLGDETSAHLGLNPERTKLACLVLASILAAACVCVSGLIAFVGLVVPHVARAVTGSDHRVSLPASALIGATFLAVTDGIGRTLIYPVEIPVGVFTALLGAPFFMILLRQRQKQLWI